MALQSLKLTFVSRCCGSTFFAPKPTSPYLLLGFDKAQRHFRARSFAAAKPAKIQVPKKRKRLDEICLERFDQYSRTFIQSWISRGRVFVDGKVVNKAGTQISDKSVVEIKVEIPKYVCRAGYKLEAALEQLDVDVTGKVALDAGLSTGGFTDCLLQHGASFVYGVDVGYGQVADKIRRDERVCVIDRTNLRYLPGLPQKVDIATLDLSFISILLVMPAVVNVMKEEATLVTLVKPQFEALRSQVGKGGIIKNPAIHQEVLEKIIKGVEKFGFCSKGWIESPLKGAEGNTEFLVHFTRKAVESTEAATEAATSHQKGGESTEATTEAARSHQKGGESTEAATEAATSLEQ